MARKLNCIKEMRGPAETQDFNGPVAGTVVAGEALDGFSVDGTMFGGFTLSVENDGDGPHTIIIFDSSNPTGGDPDLGTSNQSCGGPGVGQGGIAGGPGENCVARGNLIIVAEDIVDADGDDLVDDPDDEAGAFSGTKTLELQVPLGGAEPIYRLFPEESFDEDITVQIAYSKWLDNSVMEDGEEYKWQYRYPSQSNNWTDKSPAANFTADEDQAYARFDTGHFSDWKPKPIQG